MTAPSGRQCRVYECEKTTKGYGLCNRHYKKWRKHGDPLGGRDKRPNGEWRSLLEAAARSTSAECLVHPGWATRPNVKIGQFQANASRYVWMVANGDPGDLSVLHTCDNGSCVNICHLYLGTQLRNVRDMHERNRRPNINYARGERVTRARLTPTAVREIRHRYARGDGSQATLAAEYGVSQHSISCVVRRKSWAHID